MSEAIRFELSKIAEANNGILRAEDVVNYAKDPGTALHSKFTWDDTIAAANYRLWQARMVIRVNVEVVRNVSEPVRMYVSLKSDREMPGGGYRPIIEVMSSEKLRQNLLNEALADLKIWRKKYATLVELSGVFEAVDAAIETGVIKV